MTNEQHREYENVSGLESFARLAEDQSGVAMAATSGSPERSAGGPDESAEEVRIPGPETAGWSTLDRLATLQSFR